MLWIKKLRSFPVALLLLLGVLTACGLHNFKQTVQSGLTTLPWPKQIEATFGDEIDSFITNYGGASGPQKWQTVVYFGGRYELTLVVDVEVDYQNNRVVRALAPPKFLLNQAESTTGHETTYSGSWALDETEWNKLVAAKGDWRVLGMLLNESPIPNWDEHVKIARAPNRF